MHIIFNKYLSFPATDWTESQISYLTSLLGGIEAVEIDFDIELSCGDRKFLTDIEDNDRELEKYDGNVCLKSLPRYADTKKLFKPNKEYRFTITVSDDNTEVKFSINSRIRSSREPRLRTL